MKLILNILQWYDKQQHDFFLKVHSKNLDNTLCPCNCPLPSQITLLIWDLFHSSVFVFEILGTRKWSKYTQVEGKDWNMNIWLQLTD